MLHQIAIGFRSYITLLPKRNDHDLPSSKEINISWLIFKVTIVILKKK